MVRFGKKRLNFGNLRKAEHFYEINMSMNSFDEKRKKVIFQVRMNVNIENNIETHEKDKKGYLHDAKN